MLDGRGAYEKCTRDSCALMFGRGACLFHFPDVEDDALELLGEFWGADEEGVVQPTVLAVCGCLELGSSTEVEGGLAVSILATGYDATIANVDVDTVVSLDAIDSLQFGASLSVGQLVVGTAIDDGTLDAGTLEGASRDGDNSTAAMLGVLDGECLAEGYFQLEGKIELWSVLGWVTLCADL